MQFSKSKETLNIIFFLILVAFIFSIIYYSTFSFGSENYQIYMEGFETVPIATDPRTNKIVYGYYQVNSELMAETPYGYEVDPNDPTKILPTTKVAIQGLRPKDLPPLPKEGEKLPDGFYFGSDASLAILPPNMSPKLKNIDFSGNPAKIIYYYDNGYISETQYYGNQYIPAHYPESLPDEVYYVDEKKNLVSFLKYGEIADKTKGYGKIENPKINRSTTDFNFNTSNYRDNIKNNYGSEFHDKAEDIIKQNKMYDLELDMTRVMDKDGNMISLPKTKSQASVTYYNPGEFPFGASKYVPNYEDSVYLSSVGNRTMFGNGNSSSSSCGAICEAYKEFKQKIDNYCK